MILMYEQRSQSLYFHQTQLANIKYLHLGLYPVFHIYVSFRICHTTRYTPCHGPCHGSVDNHLLLFIPLSIHYTIVSTYIYFGFHAYYYPYQWLTSLFQAEMFQHIINLFSADHVKRPNSKLGQPFCTKATPCQALWTQHISVFIYTLSWVLINTLSWLY
jgi:hypothetical protein